MKKLTTAIIAIAILIILIIIAMVTGKTHTMKSASSSDEAVKNFLEMMIPHHEEAVATSKVIMMDGDITIPEVRLLAARIADTQEFEITQMKGWYSDWFKTEYMYDPSMYNPMMTSVTEDMKGDERAKVFLKDMIKHHEHAIEQAKETRELINDLQRKVTSTDGTLSITTTHPGIDTTLLFTEQIEKNQKKEIEEMKELVDML